MATSPTLSKIKQFTKKYPAFREGGMRHQIFHEEQYGLETAGAVVRIGRSVFIHDERYFLLVEITNTGEYPAVKKLMKGAKSRGEYLPLEDAVAQVRRGAK